MKMQLFSTKPRLVLPSLSLSASIPFSPSLPLSLSFSLSSSASFSLSPCLSPFLFLSFPHTHTQAQPLSPPLPFASISRYSHAHTPTPSRSPLPSPSPCITRGCCAGAWASLVCICPGPSRTNRAPAAHHPTQGCRGAPDFPAPVPCPAALRGSGNSCDPAGGPGGRTHTLMYTCSSCIANAMPGGGDRSCVFRLPAPCPHCRRNPHHLSPHRPFTLRSCRTRASGHTPPLFSSLPNESFPYLMLTPLPLPLPLPLSCILSSSRPSTPTLEGSRRG